MRARSEEQRERDRARSRAWHARQRLLAEAWRDWRGFEGPTMVHELYEAIWDLELPRIDKVDSLTVRMVLFAIAKFIWAPKVKRQEYTAWPGALAIAELIDRTERQVYRVLDALAEHQLIEEIRPARRPSRTRSGRPPAYRLCLERWPGRSQNLSDTGVSETRPPGGGLPPVSNQTDTGVTEAHQSDTGVTETRTSLTPVSTEAVNREASKGVRKPQSEATNARDGAREVGIKDEREFATQLAFPPIVVAGEPVGLTAPRREQLAVPLSRECPDCGQRVGAFTGKGHMPDCRRLGLRSNDPYFLAPWAEIEAALAQLPVAAEASS